MPTVLTHAAVGASLLALAPASLRRPSVVILLAGAAVLPDADVVAFSLDIAYEDPLGHRGLSHSLPFAAGVALCVAASALAIRGVGERRRIGQLASLVFLAMASHGLLDTFTNGGLGVGLWLPIDAERHFAPWRPIQVSPIGLSGFLSGPAFDVLMSELIYVGGPLAIILFSTLGLRVLRPTCGGGEDSGPAEDFVEPRAQSGE